MLEATPHNGVHVFVSGDMGSFLSPRDPIFWVHHCNVDRIWADWATALGPQASLPDAPDAQDNPNWTVDFWKAQSVGSYTDRTGAKNVTHLVGGAIDFKALGFSYDSIEGKPPGTVTVAENEAADPGTQYGLSTTNARKKIRFKNSVISARIAGSTVAVALPDPSQLAELTPLSNVLQSFKDRISDSSKTSVFTLNMSGIPVPPDTNARYVCYVYLGAEGKPSTNFDGDPNVVGTINFFGIHDHGGGHDLTTINVSFDVTDVMAGLVRNSVSGPIFVVFRGFLHDPVTGKDTEINLPTNFLKATTPFTANLKVNA